MEGLGVGMAGMTSQGILGAVVDGAETGVGWRKSQFLGELVVRDGEGER